MRLSSKLVVLDPAGRVLLLDCVDPGEPGTTWQELPGGGPEPGEDAVAAGVREVLEETGVVVPCDAVGALQWSQVASYTWLRRRHTALFEGRVARLPAAPVVRSTRLTGPEAGTILAPRWWTRPELAAHPGRFFPRSLPALLPRLLAGERVEEPYDDWDLPDAAPAAPAPR